MSRSVSAAITVFAVACLIGGLTFSRAGAADDERPNADARSAGTAAAESQMTYWIFLTAGKSPAGTEQAALSKMQSDHINNFKRLAGEGKLFVAGPMADPARKIRGIVGVRAEKADQLPDYFKPDPLVQNGFLTLDAIPMHIGIGRFRVDVKPEGLDELRLVLLEKAAADTKQLEEPDLHRNLEYCQSIFDNERLLFAAKLHDSEHGREAIMIFRKMEDKKLQSLVDDLPAVKSKSWKATAFPLYLTKGVLDP